jgi:hypothetical protein
VTLEYVEQGKERWLRAGRNDDLLRAYLRAETARLKASDGLRTCQLVSSGSVFDSNLPLAKIGAPPQEDSLS